MMNPIMTEMLVEARIRDLERQSAARSRAASAQSRRRYLRRARRTDGV